MQVSGRLVIAVDGKAVRGAKDQAARAPHLAGANRHHARDPQRTLKLL